MNNFEIEAQEVFDRQYKARGLSAQRMYPSEALIQFLGGAYFRLSLEERRAIRILEVGCGSGANLWMVAKEGFETHGMDSSDAGLQLAREHLGTKWGVSATLKQGSFLALPYDSEFFDAVLDVVSLQHLCVADTQLALSEIHRVLKPGGRFFSYRLSDRSTMFETAAMDQRLDEATLSDITDSSQPLAHNGPISFVSSSLVRQMYSTAGLQVTSILRNCRTYPSGSIVEYLAIDARKA